jgi:hypothetical protein
LASIDSEEVSMKNGIFFTLLILAVQALQAEAAESRWIKTKEGCSVLLDYLTTVDSVSWNGKCSGGRLEGVGVITYVRSGQKVRFIEEYMGGVRAYPYILDGSGAIRVNGGMETPAVKLDACKRIVECEALYKYSVRNKKYSALDNRIGADAEVFRNSAIAIMAGGKAKRIPMSGGYSLEMDYSGVTSKTASAGANSDSGIGVSNVGTADGFEFSREGGKITAKGGPCAAAGLKAVSVGNGVFDQVRSGKFMSSYYLDGVMHSNRGFDIHITLSPDVGWAETVRHNRRAANQMSESNEAKEDAVMEADVSECLARNQSQYAIAFERWVRANKP